VRVGDLIDELTASIERLNDLVSCNQPLKDREMPGIEDEWLTLGSAKGELGEWRVDYTPDDGTYIVTCKAFEFEGGSYRAVGAMELIPFSGEWKSFSVRKMPGKPHHPTNALDEVQEAAAADAMNVLSTWKEENKDLVEERYAIRLLEVVCEALIFAREEVDVACGYFIGSETARVQLALKPEQRPMFRELHRQNDGVDPQELADAVRALGG
jgi:hypothetical protein